MFARRFITRLSCDSRDDVGIVPYIPQNLPGSCRGGALPRPYALSFRPGIRFSLVGQTENIVGANIINFRQRYYNIYRYRSFTSFVSPICSSTNRKTISHILLCPIPIIS